MGGKVTHVAREYGRPSETFVADTVRNLDALGWEGRVVAGAVGRRDWFPHPPDDRLLIARRPRRVTRMAGRALRRPTVERSAAWYTPAIVATAPDVVHAHFGWAGPLAAPAARRLGVPLAVTFHATDVTVWPHEAAGNRRAYARLFGHIGLAMAVSRFTEAALRAAGYEGPVAIEPAGISLADLPYRGPRASGDPVRILFIGRLVPRKGLDVLLQALARIDARHTLRLTVVGDGPLREPSEALARSLGIGDRVEMRGALPHAEVRQALMESDLLAMPSRTTPDGEAEGSPTVVKEALAAGLAVVASDNGGTVEVLPPGQRDEIVPEDDPVALAARLEAVIDDRGAWPGRAEAGRRWVEKEFDAQRLAARLAERYAALV